MNVRKVTIVYNFKQQKSLNNGIFSFFDINVILFNKNERTKTIEEDDLSIGQVKRRSHINLL